MWGSGLHRGRTDETRVSEIGDEILKIANVKEISLYKEDSYNYVVDDMFEGR